VTLKPWGAKVWQSRGTHNRLVLEECRERAEVWDSFYTGYNMSCFGFFLIEFIYFLHSDIESVCSDK